MENGDLTNGVMKVDPIKVEHKNLTNQTTYNYVLTIKFNESNKEQNHNKGKDFIGSVEVSIN